MIVRLPAAEDEFVVYYDVPWDTYEAILDAIGRYHLRHAYDRGTFEFRRLLCGVSWEDYQKLLAATGKMSLPHTYDRGWLEIMSPLKVHDWDKTLIGRMLEAMCLDLDILLHGVGSMTVSSKRAERGFQPDEAYYIANESRVQSKPVFEPDVDPPPDLILEVDVTSKSIKRSEVYAATRIPEWWRYEKGRLTFHVLARGGKYKESNTSKALPFLASDDFQPFFAKAGQVPDNTLIKQFVGFARRRFKEHAAKPKGVRGGKGSKA